MTETFRDIIDLFPDRRDLADRWNRKVPDDRKISAEAVNLWHHRDSVPGWSWAGFEAAAAELGHPEITLARLVAADLEARRQRADKRKGSEAAA